jgi:hypothetical protein
MIFAPVDLIMVDDSRLFSRHFLGTFREVMLVCDKGGNDLLAARNCNPKSLEIT